MTDPNHALQQLSLEEKAQLCSGADYWHTAGITRANVASLMLADGPHGLRVQTNPADHSGMKTSLPATCFPTAATLGSTWDPVLIREVGNALAEEASAQGISVVLGPGVNIKRSLLCGRNFEYFSEDPYLTGQLATAYVQGVQARGVGTSLKHFAVNNQETDRMRVSAEVDERTVREIYLTAFERCIKEAQPWTVMCAYNRINGTYASEHRWLLTDVLRGEWGFRGLVVSDWGAVHDRLAALRAGLDLEMPPDLPRSPAALVGAVESGALDEAELDQTAIRVLELVRKATSHDTKPKTFDVRKHHDLARVVAAQGTVLLKNTESTLPLRLEPGATVAVIGEFARAPRYQGAGSSRVNPTRVETFLEEFSAVVPDGVAVSFAQGFTLDSDGHSAPLAEEAVHVAAQADVTILLMGLPESAESEGFDRRNIDLPMSQVALLKRLRLASGSLVVMLANGGVVDVASWDDNADAILECWLGGQAGASAAAQILVGESEPAGRLAETIPNRLADSPAFLAFPGEGGHVRYGEGLYVGYRYYDARDVDVAYPFGFGLSYTTFRYDELELIPAGGPSDDGVEARVSVRVTNTGDRAGHEVVQVYVGNPTTAGRARRELRAFAKIHLEPGSSEVVSLTLDRRAFAHWSVSASDWVVPAGRYVLEVGASSRDIRLSATLTRTGERVPEVTLDDGSSLDEWLADDHGREILIRAVGVDSRGQPEGIIGDADRLRVVGNFPIRTMAVFPNTGITHEVVDAVCAEITAAPSGGARGSPGLWAVGRLDAFPYCVW